MANALITPQIIAAEALFHLENNVVLGGQVHRDYKKEFVKIGDSLTIRRPVQFLVSDGATRVNQDVVENTTSITINQRKHVSWLFSSQDLTLTVYEYADRYIKPAMIALANQIDQSIALEGANEFYHLVGTAGTTPNTFNFPRQVAERMDLISVPDDGGRCLVVSPQARWGLAEGMGTTNNQSIFNAGIVGDMIRKGYLGDLAGLKLYGDQNITNHQWGPINGTPLVDGVTAEAASSIVIDGATASQTPWIREGDVFTMAGVNAVNPVSPKQDANFLMPFVATADADSSAGGAVTIPIFPAIRAAGAYQNVTALPADNAALAFPTTPTGAASYPFNLGFHKNALALVTVPLELPDSVVFKARAEWNGFSIRVIKDYDIENDQEIIRLDVLYGVKAIYPDLGVKLTG